MATDTVHRTCTGCGETKELSEFPFTRDPRIKNPGVNGGPGGSYGNWCRVCRYHINRLRNRGCTEAEYSELKARAGDRCESCGDLFTLTQEHIDHNHQTGRIRGLICRPCNQALGMLQDDPERARALANYVEERDAL